MHTALTLDLNIMAYQSLRCWRKNANNINTRLDCKVWEYRLLYDTGISVIHVHLITFNIKNTFSDRAGKGEQSQRVFVTSLLHALPHKADEHFSRSRETWRGGFTQLSHWNENMIRTGDVHQSPTSVAEVGIITELIDIYLFIYFSKFNSLSESQLTAWHARPPCFF